MADSSDDTAWAARYALKVSFLFQLFIAAEKKNPALLRISRAASVGFASKIIRVRLVSPSKRIFQPFPLIVFPMNVFSGIGPRAAFPLSMVEGAGASAATTGAGSSA